MRGSHAFPRFLIAQNYALFTHSPITSDSTIHVSTTMSAPKSKSAPVANGTAKGKGPSTSGTATPTSAVADKDNSDQLVTFAGGRPDKAAHDADQTRIKSEIDSLQVKLVSVASD